MKRSVESIKKREEAILNLINEKGRVEIEEICEVFSISPSTARSQLRNMKSKGMIERVHGGAISIQSLEGDNKSFEQINYIGNTDNIEAKEAIAKLAATLIEEEDVVAITGGSTTYVLSKYLNQPKEFTVITNSLPVAYELKDCKQIDIRICGGILNHDRYSLSGIYAESFFKNTNINKFIFSVDAVNLKSGITLKDSTVSHLEREILIKSEQTILLVDSDKFNRKNAIDNIGLLDSIDYIVTDSNVEEEILNGLHDMGVKVLVADIN